MKQVPFEVLMHAESALNASEEAMAVLELWLESIPSDAPNSDACLVGAIMSLLHSGIKELVKAREACSAK